MNLENYQEQLMQAYMSSTGDSIHLFETVLAVAGEIGLEAALAGLEQCVIEKRRAWLDAHPGELNPGDDPVGAGYHCFYGLYLRVAIPEQGQIIERTGQKIVTRWWNRCPTLEACQKLGLDTRQVCRLVYERPVGEFLQRIDPRLRFARNYAAIRPYQEYCEETIYLE